MLKRKDDVPVERILAFLERHWKVIIVAAWLITCAWWAYQRWSNILTFNLGDTDDNMRMMQVRALLHGQDWFDLRQYRLNPPFGANIHWSRLVDLPLPRSSCLPDPSSAERTPSGSRSRLLRCFPISCSSLASR